MKSLRLMSIASLALASLAVDAHAEDQVVKLGLAGPLTGSQAEYGKDVQEGAELAVSQVNGRHPVIDGKPTRFVLVSEDDQADPKTGTIVAQRLVDTGIKGMLGHVNSGVSIPAAAVYARAGIPQVSVSSAPAFTHLGLKTTFRSCGSDTQQGSEMAGYVINVLHASRIVVIDDRTAYGQGLADQFINTVTKNGGKILDRQYVSDKSIDFRGILTSIKGERPDLIYFAGAAPQSGPMIKQARDLNIAAQFVSGDMSQQDDFIKLAGAAANGSLISVPGLPFEQMPGAKDFLSSYKAKFGHEPEHLAPYSYDGAMAVMKAMEQANSSNPSTYLPVLSKIEMEGVTTNRFAFDSNGDQRYPVVSIYKVEAGKFAPIWNSASN